MYQILKGSKKMIHINHYTTQNTMGGVRTHAS